MVRWWEVVVLVVGSGVVSFLVGVKVLRVLNRNMYWNEKEERYVEGGREGVVR